MSLSILSLEKSYFKAHDLYERGKTKRARRLSGMYNLIHSCDIPCESTIGTGTIFAHSGIGIVINKKAIIGKNCHIFHGVTIGGRGGEHDNTQPRIGNNVFIGCNASILGDVTIGDGATIGANSVVLSNVPSGATAVGVPARVIKTIVKIPC